MRERPARVSNPEACGLRHLAFQAEFVSDTVAELKENGMLCKLIYTGRPVTFFHDPVRLPIEIQKQEGIILCIKC